MRLLLILLAILCLLAAAATFFVWSGTYNVAANVPHWNLTNWLLDEVREQSIASHSKGTIIPSSKDPRLAAAGFRHYHAMCRLCHNAPGYPRTEISRGLYPAPPDFTAKDTALPSTAEIYWIARNGIKMTGMPAFGGTHSDEELWEIVFFVKGLSNMKPEEYHTMVGALNPHKEGGHHH